MEKEGFKKMRYLGNKLKKIGQKHQVKINKVFTTYSRFQDRNYARHIRNGTYGNMFSDKEIDSTCLKYTDRHFSLYGRCGK